MQQTSEKRIAHSVLTQNGLSSKEAKVYVALLELGETTPLDISRRIQMKRPTVYVILEGLLERGLVSYVRRGRGLRYSALDVRNLYSTQEDALTRLKNSLPMFAAFMRQGASARSSEMRVFEGVAGLRRAMEDTLTSRGEILCWVDLELVTMKYFKTYWREYLKKRITRKLRVRAIMVSDQAAASFRLRDKEELRESVLIPKSRFPLHGEMNIYNDKIALLSYDDPIAVVIQNRAMADMQRSIFNLSFEFAQQLGKHR
jgi:sugar-specific transcriptional regulator TrmB